MFSCLFFPCNNICIFCDSHKLNVYNESTLEMNALFSRRVDDFYNYLIKKHSISYEKTIDHLFLPRSKVENSGERPFDYAKVYEFIGNDSYTEYDTMNTTDYYDQIKLLSSAKNVYLDFGSSFIVNGLFCKDSTIYLTDTHGIIGQIDEYKSLKIVYEKIEANNIIIILPK